MHSRRCLHHGGSGNPAKPKVATGTRIREDYERVLKDEQLLSLREEIAWQRAYFLEIQRMAAEGTLGGPSLFAAIAGLNTAWDDFTSASRSGTTPARRQAVSKALSEAVEALAVAAAEAARAAEARKELRETSQTLGFLIDKEIKQLERLYGMITAERALALREAEQVAVLKAIEKFVPDRTTQIAIRREIVLQFSRTVDRPTVNLPPIDADSTIDMSTVPQPVQDAADGETQLQDRL